jgi:RNA polymerase sigma factor for flagellar operon FliA
MNTATQRLIEEHLDYAKALAAKVRRRAGLPRHVETAELEGWALLGLTQAAERFDAGRGVPFGAFAQRRIVGAVLNGLGKMHQAPESARQKARRLERLQDTLPEVEAGQVAPEAAADQLARSIDRAGACVLVQRLGGPSEALSGDDPVAACEEREARGRLREAVAGLPELLRKVMTLYYFEDKSMAEVGEELRISTPTVCRRHKDALAKLAASLGREVMVL